MPDSPFLWVFFRGDSSSTRLTSGGFGEPRVGHAPFSNGSAGSRAEEEGRGGAAAGDAAGWRHGAPERAGAREHQRQQRQTHGDEEAAAQTRGEVHAPPRSKAAADEWGFWRSPCCELTLSTFCPSAVHRHGSEEHGWARGHRRRPGRGSDGGVR